MTLQEIYDAITAVQTELKVLVDKETPTADDAAQAEELATKIEGLQLQAKKFEKLDVIRKNAATVATPAKAEGYKVVADPTIKAGRAPIERMDVKAHAGAFLVATFNPSTREQYKDLTGVSYHTHTQAVDSSGGIFVPNEVSSSIIDLQIEYGAFARNAQIEKMNSETLLIPRYGSDVQSYWGTEQGTMTASDIGAIDGVTLVARKIYAYGLITEELNMNSIVNIGDRWIRSAARSMAKKIDQAAFVGTGTSTYGGITGITTALTNLSGTIANIAGLTVATGNLFSEFTMSDFTNVKNLLPEYAHAGAKWYMNRRTWGQTAERLALALGGVSAAEVAGSLGQRFLGYPVEFVEVLPSADVNSQVAVLFGDMKLAASLGDRAMLSVKQDTSLGFREDIIHIKQTQYLDVAIHDVGNASATASLRQAGPLVGIISAAS